MSISHSVIPAASAAAHRLGEHLTQCAFEYIGDGYYLKWTTPEGERFTVDVDAQAIVMVGADGQRYGVDVSVVAWPLREGQ